MSYHAQRLKIEKALRAATVRIGHGLATKTPKHVRSGAEEAALLIDEALKLAGEDLVYGFDCPDCGQYHD